MHSNHMMMLEVPDTHSEASELDGKHQEQASRINYNPLPQILGTRDLVVFFVLTVVFLLNINVVQFGGPSSFLYWALGFSTFLIPCALVTQWMMKQFPGVGGHYLWAKQVMGVQWGFISAFCAWLPCVLASISIVSCALAIGQYLFPALFTTSWLTFLCVVMLLIVAAGVAFLPLRHLKRVLLVLTILYLSVFALLGVAGVWWLMQGHASASSFAFQAGWTPTASNVAVYGIIILALLGTDTPLFLEGEIRGEVQGVRRASSFVWWGVLISFFAYVLGTFGVYVIMPASQSSSFTASIGAVQLVFGPEAAYGAGVCLLLGQLAMISTYILMTSRMLVVVAADRRLPFSLTASNHSGVPILSIALQALIIIVCAIFALVLAPGIFVAGNTSTSLALIIYNVLQGSASVIWTISSVQLLAFPLMLFVSRTKRKKISATRSMRIALMCFSVLGIVASLVGIWETITGSWVPSLMPNSQWTSLIVTITLCSLFVGWAISEIPRIHALLTEQKLLTAREKKLRAQLQKTYEQQEVLVAQLQEARREQDMAVQQQQVLLDEVKRLYDEQKQAAVTDAITNLPNHRAIMKHLDEELARCERTNIACAVLFIDLDHFKHINDTWGHQAGDTILRETASRLRATIRTEDFVGRYGGEEFALILANVTMDTACEIAERLRLAVCTVPCAWQGDDGNAIQIAVTASIGVAMYGLHGTRREALLEQADQAMYEAKLAGRNRVRVAGVEIEEEDALTSTPQGQKQQEEPILQVLTTVASLHDLGTLNHSQRMIELAEATARHLQRSEEELHLVHLGALLHDIGKVGIPDAILHKPGPLTDDEWKVMRKHPEIGRQILQQAGGIFGVLARIVVAHHERWDGAGYPLGLTQETIPLAARILAVVDSFDAMTARRVYREPFTVEQARQELQRCAGTQYDPQVVTAFLKVLDEHLQREMDGLQKETQARVDASTHDQLITLS